MGKPVPKNLRRCLLSAIFVPWERGRLSAQSER